MPCQAAEVDELQHLQRALPAFGLPNQSVRECAPTRTFSSTVIRENSAMFWNVRAMPRRTTWYGASFSRSSPS